MGFFNGIKSTEKKVKLYEAHRCSACGELNASEQSLVIKYHYDESVLARSGMSVQERSEKTLNDTAQKLLRAAADGDVKCWYDLDLLGRCGKCGRSEPWSRIRLRILEPIRTALAVICFASLLAGIVLLCTVDNAVMLIVSGVLIAVTLGVLLFQRMRRISREKAIAALAQDSLPFLTDDEEAFRERYPDCDPGQLEHIEPAGAYQMRDF